MDMPVDVFVEETDGGFVLADYRGEAAFMGEGDAGWQGDISLVTPFATVAAARAAFTLPDVTPPAPAPKAKQPKAKK